MLLLDIITIIVLIILWGMGIAFLLAPKSVIKTMLKSSIWLRHANLDNLSNQTFYIIRIGFGVPFILSGIYVLVFYVL